MNTQELINKLGQEVVISYISDVKLTGGKKNDQQGRVTKLTENLLVTLTSNAGEYQKRMQTNVDVNFTPKARKWGVRNKDGLIEHNGELYVEFLVEGRGISTYQLDGQPILKDKIVGLPATTTEQETENDVVIRCVKVSNLLSVE